MIRARAAPPARGTLRHGGDRAERVLRAESALASRVLSRIGVKRASFFASLASVALATTAACGSSSSGNSPPPGSTTISASSYDQSCQTAADCVPVAVGDACQTCGLACASDAINKNAETKYQADVKQAEALCNPPPQGCGVDCIAFTVTCTAGKCGGCTGSSCADAGGGDAGDAGRDASGE
jgi:hypothetical protein